MGCTCWWFDGGYYSRTCNIISHAKLAYKYPKELPIEEPMTDPVKIIGRVIKVSKQGWGFISSKEIEFTRIFFHWTALRQDTVTFTELKTGMHVEFTPLQVPGKGWRAVHVRVIEREKTNEVSTLLERGPDNDGANNGTPE